MNLLAKGQLLLVRLLARDASPAGAVIYERVSGAETDLTGSCWVGRTVYSRLPVDGGPAIVYGDRDYLVPVAALDGHPRRGDRFIEDVGTTTPKTYEVVSVLDEPEWRYADPGETIYRVHTKRVE